MADLLRLLATILGAWFFASLVVTAAWILAKRRDPPPEPPRRVGIRLTLFECERCHRVQMWSERLGGLTCICGGTYRDAWQEPRVLREAAEIVRQVG